MRVRVVCEFGGRVIFIDSDAREYTWLSGQQNVLGHISCGEHTDGKKSKEVPSSNLCCTGGRPLTACDIIDWWRIGERKSSGRASLTLITMGERWGFEMWYWIETVRILNKVRQRMSSIWTLNQSHFFGYETHSMDCRKTHWKKHLANTVAQFQRYKLNFHGA